MDFVITPFWLFVLCALLSFILSATVDKTYIWILVLAFGALFSSSELLIHIDAKSIVISYLPPEATTGEKGGV